MTRGLRNNNPLNIRRNKTKWQGLSVTQTDKSFFQFKTMAYGYRAAFKTDVYKRQVQELHRQAARQSTHFGMLHKGTVRNGD